MLCLQELELFFNGECFCWFVFLLFGFFFLFCGARFFEVSNP